MDAATLERLQELKIAPRSVFDDLASRHSRPRFMVPCNTTTAESESWRAVTWGAHATQIRRVARFLASESIGAGDRCAIFAPNSVAWMSAALGVQAAGGVMVPIYGSSTAEQAAYVVEHADARVVFVDTAALLSRVFERWSQYSGVRRIVVIDDVIEPARVLAKLRAQAIVALPTALDVLRRVLGWSDAQRLGAALDADEPDAFDRTLRAVDLDQPGVMLYTSGTSGNPKGVPLSHRNVGVNGRDWLACNAPLLREEMVDLLWLPMSHIFGFGEACLGNSLGFTSYLCDPRQVLEQLPIVRPSVLMSVPSIWEKLAAPLLSSPAEGDPMLRRSKLARVTGGALEFCLSGGAGLKREVKEAFHSTGLLIVEGYGLTETSPTLTLNRPDAFRFDSVGKVLPSVEVRLAEDGEILARGASVFRGYHKDDAATREAFDADGWFKTGDVGRFTDDGFLQIIDRKKDILVTAGGKNVAPANLEIRFDGDPLISHVVVFGDGEKYLVAGIWVNEEEARPLLAGYAESERPAALAKLVQGRVDKVNGEVAGYESIKRFRIMPTALTIEGGLLTPTLKVRRKKVYAVFAREFAGLYA